MIRFLKKNVYVCLLVVIAIALFITNYKSNTYLLGWDSLQTELNPALAVKRAIFSVWEEYQSFGLMAGMAHASDLPRAIFIWITSFVLPQNTIRYFFHILMLFVGGVGMLRLLDVSLRTKNRTLTFIGALFYMLNLGTVQIFYVPFEPFSIFFAALPWEIWIFLKLINKQTVKQRKYLFLFFFINLLATPQAYIQTLFVVYFLILICFVLGKIWETRSFSVVKNSVLLLLIVVTINSYWILPQLYFLKSGGNKIVEQAKINQLATDDVLYQNKEKGTVIPFLKLEGFYYDLSDINHQPLFSSWKTHFNSITIGTIQYLFIGLTFLGLFISLKNNKKYSAFILIWLLCTMVLLSNVFPISLINAFLRSKPFVNQIFRSPFTKFIIPYSLVSSFFFILGVETLLKKFKPATTIVSAFLIILILIYSSPSFSSNFFSNQMKIKLPQSYLDAISYFNTVDKNQRIALLPDYTFWGWFFTKWGYDGSGFLWYGIEQPIVSRTFDVWSDKSEDYFWQIKNAIEMQDEQKFNNVLKKYDINYLLVDTSLLPVTGTNKGLQYNQLDTLLNQNPQISLVKRWPEISIYKIVGSQKAKNFTSVAYNLPNIFTSETTTNNDIAFNENNDYISDYEESPEIYYPFEDLFSQRRLPKAKWSIKETDKNIILKTELPKSVRNYNIKAYPSIKEQFIDKNNQIKNVELDYFVVKNNNTLTVTLPKNLLTSFNPSRAIIENCGQAGKNTENKTKNTLSVESRDKAIGCFSYIDNKISQQYGYLVYINSINNLGRRFFFYISDETNRQSILEDRLINNQELYILPPHFDYGLGYSFSFQNNSYTGIPAKNKLETLNIYNFPYDSLKQLKLIKNPRINISSAGFSKNFKAIKQNYFVYFVSLNQQNNIEGDQTVILNQSFDKGWLAYELPGQNTNFLSNYLPFFFGKEIKNHVLVNNWANGWLINGQNQIVIIFWPQYLEFLGFILLFLGLIWIVKMKNNSLL